MWREYKHSVNPPMLQLYQCNANLPLWNNSRENPPREPQIFQRNPLVLLHCLPQHQGHIPAPCRPEYVIKKHTNSQTIDKMLLNALCVLQMTATCRKKSFGLSRRLGQRSEVMREVRVLTGSQRSSDPRIVPSSPWLISTHTKQELSVWFSLDTETQTPCL